MTYVLELEPEIARQIGVKAASFGVSPEEFLTGFITRMSQTKYADPAEVRRVIEKLFTERAEVFIALAKSKREDRKSLLRAQGEQS